MGEGNRVASKRLGHGSSSFLANLKKGKIYWHLILNRKHLKKKKHACVRLSTPPHRPNGWVMLPTATFLFNSEGKPHSRRQ